MRLFARSAKGKRVLRVVRTDRQASADLIEAVGDAVEVDDVVERLAEFYRERGMALELRRPAAVVSAADWSGLQRRLELLGGAGLLPGPPMELTRRERDDLEQRIELLANVVEHAELAETIRSDIADVIDDIRLRMRDPESAARATVDRILDPEQRFLEDLAGAALEVCTGPDPIALDILLPLGVPPVYDVGVELIRLEDGCANAEQAFLVLDDDLDDLAGRCAEVRERMDPAWMDETFAAEIERLGELARALDRDAGLLLARVVDVSA